MRSRSDEAAPGEPHQAHKSILTRTGKNFAWLVGSTGFSAVASLIYIALTARTLGPPGFGTFALIMTYGELATNLAQFQSWKAVIGFGAPHQHAGVAASLRRLFGYAASLDWMAGIFGSSIAIAGTVLIGPLLHWSPAEEHQAAWFATALLMTSSTAPAGMLRLVNRFDLQAYSESLAQITRFAGCLTGWLLGGGVNWFLGVWALAALLQLVSQWAAVFALGHRFTLSRRAFVLATHENPGLWSFMLKTNISGSLNLFWMQCGTLVVGAHAGATEAGGFRLAHRFGLAMMKPVEIATKAFFPELARLVADGDQAVMRRVLVRVSCIGAAFASIVVLGAGLFGREILHLTAGSRFEFAHEFLFLLCIAAAINVCGFALEPFLNAHFRAGTVLRSNLVAALLYVALLVGLLPVYGADAAAFASIFAAAVIVVQLGASTVRILARADEPAASKDQGSISVEMAEGGGAIG